jgi:hypothetical protein
VVQLRWMSQTNGRGGGSRPAIAAKPGYPTVIVPFGTVPKAPAGSNSLSDLSRLPSGAGRRGWCLNFARKPHTSTETHSGVGVSYYTNPSFDPWKLHSVPVILTLEWA